MNAFLSALIILSVGSLTSNAMFLKPHQVQAEMLELAAKAVNHIKKSEPLQVPPHDLATVETDHQDINLILPYNYEIDSNANGIFDEDDQNQLKIFLTALENFARKNGRQRFG